MKSTITIALYYFVLIVLCLSLLTCGRGDNAKPVIEKLILPVTVQPGETAVFRVVALDPDGDQLTYIWIINGETSSTKLSTMTWETVSPIVITEPGGNAAAECTNGSV